METGPLPVRLNLGCGADLRPGYVNVDAHVDGIDLKMSLLHLGVRERSVDEILCSHVLEHFGKYEVPQLLAVWRRALKPEGKLVVVVPDVAWCMQQWLRLPDSERWGWALDAIFGLQDHPGEFHKTGFTPVRLESLLREAGFDNIVITTPFDHGMRSIRAEACLSSDSPAVPRKGRLPWLRKHLVFTFFRLAHYLDRATA